MMKHFLELMVSEQCYLLSCKLLNKRSGNLSEKVYSALRIPTISLEESFTQVQKIVQLIAFEDHVYFWRVSPCKHQIDFDCLVGFVGSNHLECKAGLRESRWTN